MTPIIKKEQVPFSSGKTRCVGYLYHSKAEKAPCVILCTGFGGTQDTPSLIAMAEALAEAGFAAFTFDYRTFGESGGEPRQIVDVKGQLEDIAAALEAVRSRPEVDSAWLGLWGSSLGGGHVIVTAAEIPGIQAVVAQIPFNGFPKKVEGRSFMQTMRLLHTLLKDRRNGKKGKPPAYIAAVGLPGELAVMTSNEAASTISGMKSATWRNEVAPRGVLDMMKYKPSDYSPQVKCPVMVCYGERDKEAQGLQTLELIESLPHVEGKAYPLAHFDFYNPEIRAGIIREQLRFYQQHL